MAYINQSISARQKAAKEWEKLNRARYQELQRAASSERGSWPRGSAAADADARKRTDFAKTLRGQELKKLGGNAFEIAFRNKYYGGYRKRPGANENDSTEYNIFKEMTGQQNPYSGSRGQGVGGTVTKNFGAAGLGAAGPLIHDDPMQAFLDDVQGQTNAANQANETRYQDILAGYDDRYTRNTDILRNMGDYNLMQAEESIGDAARKHQAMLSGRGAGDRAGNVMARAARNLTMANAGINAETAKLLAQNDATLSGDKLAFMERRTDEAPDYAQMMAMAEKYGLGNAGQGFGYSGGGGGGGGGGNFRQPLLDLMGTPVFGSAVVGGRRQYPSARAPKRKRKKKQARGVPYQGPKKRSKKAANLYHEPTVHDEQEQDMQARDYYDRKKQRALNRSHYVVR